MRYPRVSSRRSRRASISVGVLVGAEMKVAVNVCTFPPRAAVRRPRGFRAIRGFGMEGTTYSLP
jgi:hypothetical protein